MTNLEIYILASQKVISNFWPVGIYILATVIHLGRRNILEKKRVAKASQRDKLKRIHN